MAPYGYFSEPSLPRRNQRSPDNTYCVVAAVLNVLDPVPVRAAGADAGGCGGAHGGGGGAATAAADGAPKTKRGGVLWYK